MAKKKKKPSSSKRNSVAATGGITDAAAALANHEVMQQSDPMIKATKTGDCEMIKQIVLAHSHPTDRVLYVNMFDRNGSTPIFHTVWPGHCDALRLLLQYGADPNVRNNRLNTALHLACERGHRDVIQTLIEYGADIHMRNWKQRTCYEMAETEEAAQELKRFCEECRSGYEERMMKELDALCPAEDRAHFKALFDAIDSDGSGWLSVDELRPLLQTMTGGAPTEEELVEFYNWFDTDHNHKVFFAEFLRGVLKYGDVSLSSSSATTTSSSSSGSGGDESKSSDHHQQQQSGDRATQPSPKESIVAKTNAVKRETKARLEKQRKDSVELVETANKEAQKYKSKQAAKQ